MERIKITKENTVLKSGEYIIESFDNLELETEVNSDINILVCNLPNKSLLKLLVKEDSRVTLSILTETASEDVKMSISVQKNGYVDGYLADFSKDSMNFKCVIDLNEEGATGNFKVASLAANKDIKNIDVSINHNAPQTYGKADNYGVCKDSAKMSFLGTSWILHGSVKSNARQNAKIMVFDEESNAIAKPILKIDENDIKAGHGAAVGKINDEHLFYLTSRGISEAEAKELITFGYLKPILLGFKEEMIKEHISSLIEGRM